MTQKVMTNDEAVSGSKKFFFAIFGTFGRYITNLRGTFVENVKKVDNQPTLLHSPVGGEGEGGATSTALRFA
jgi:hypothetical protein